MILIGYHHFPTKKLSKHGCPSHLWPNPTGLVMRLKKKNANRPTMYLTHFQIRNMYIHIYIYINGWHMILSHSHAQFPSPKFENVETSFPSFKSLQIASYPHCSPHLPGFEAKNYMNPHSAKTKHQKLGFIRKNWPKSAKISFPCTSPAIFLGLPVKATVHWPCLALDLEESGSSRRWRRRSRRRSDQRVSASINFLEHKAIMEV